MNNKLGYTGARTDGTASYSFKISLSLSILVIMLALCAGQAWSFERIPAGETGRYIDNPPMQDTQDFSSSSPVQNDACLPLLNNHASAGSAMNRNQRTAGKAAALGLVFGIRFALQPSREFKPSKPSLDVWAQDGGVEGDRSALAIADYRRCQKDRALKSSIQALGEFRWRR